MEGLQLGLSLTNTWTKKGNTIGAWLSALLPTVTCFTVTVVLVDCTISIEF